MELFRIARSLKTVGLVACLAGGLTTPAAAQVSYTVSPSSLTFPKTAAGVISDGRSVTVTNTGTVSLTISSFSITPSEFLLVNGWAPIILLPGAQEVYQLKFAPDAAQTFTGQLTITIAGVTNSIIVPLSGKGFTTSAVAQVSPTTLSFGPQTLGTTSAPQTVTVTNAGTSDLMVTAASVLPPFSLSGFSGSTTLTAGQSLSVQVTFFATQVGSYNNTLVFSHDVVNSSGAALTGTAIAPSSLAVTAFPVLPTATQSSAYSAVLSSAGGTGATNWSLSPGSKLPTGLTLSSAGVISGTLDPSVAKGNHSFSVGVRDSASHAASETLTLPVNGLTGAKCSNISTNVAGTNSPIVPIPDLGTGTYLGSQAGLYPGGTNTRPAGHDADGVAFANAIQPLDANGKPDPNGKYVLLSIGMSAAHTLFVGFQNYVIADPTVDKTHLVLVNGAQDNATAGIFAQPGHPVWTDIMDYFLPQSHVTANQVVAAWVNDVAYPSGTFPGDMATLQTNLEEIARILHRKFPNLKLAYFTGRMYGGYSNNPKNPESPEPYAYESGFPVKWSIQDQLDGLATLNYDPHNGPPQAPWIDWNSYMWANGLTPRSDGFVWTCQDYTSDGIHPSLPPLSGRDKGANLMMNFFKTDDTTAPWFLAH
ncbi:MAG: choice-of-anchor D domain-containing protein [Acidobacteriia bacterium]|nr:choice-of-anchor D domain-containing protein [Terriglobia bacterium]